MVNKDTIYWILFISTEFTLFILLIICVQQFCTTDNFKEKPRLRRTLLVTFNVICFLIHNALIHLSTIFPDFKIILNLNFQNLYILWEAIVIIIAFHTFRLLLTNVIEMIYHATNIHTPKWFPLFINSLESIIMVSVLICYSLEFIANDIDFIYYFYMILCVVVITEAIFITIMINKPLKILGEVRIVPNVNDHIINSAKRRLKGAMYTALFLIVVAIFDILFDLQMVDDIFHLDSKLSDHSLGQNVIILVLHELFVNMLSFALTLWVFKPKYCCKIPKNSVCDIWCCKCYLGYWYKRKKMMVSDNEISKNNPGPLLTRDASTGTSINTNNVTTWDTNTNPQLSVPTL